MWKVRLEWLLQPVVYTILPFDVGVCDWPRRGYSYPLPLLPQLRNMAIAIFLEEEDPWMSCQTGDLAIHTEVHIYYLKALLAISFQEPSYDWAPWLIAFSARTSWLVCGLREKIIC